MAEGWVNDILSRLKAPRLPGHCTSKQPDTKSTSRKINCGQLRVAIMYLINTVVCPYSMSPIGFLTVRMSGHVLFLHQTVGQNQERRMEEYMFGSTEKYIEG